MSVNPPIRTRFRQMQTTINKIHLLPIDKLQTPTKLKEQVLLKRLSQGDCSAFWELWQQHQDYLYHRCLRSMGGNYINAEEAFSQATLKAWDKLPDYAGKITNVRAWLTRLTHNLCVDIHREHRRRAMAIESIEEIVVRGNEAVISSFDSPDSAILRNELRLYIRHAVDSLSSRLRTPFILRYYHQISYQDIAQQLALSVDNVYKRIQQARKILRLRLRRYLSGLDDSLLDSSESSCKRGKSVVERCQSDQTTISDSTAPMTMGCMDETINYQVTATCRETLPHAWYCSPSPLGWN